MSSLRPLPRRILRIASLRTQPQSRLPSSQPLYASKRWSTSISQRPGSDRYVYLTSSFSLTTSIRHPIHISLPRYPIRDTAAVANFLPVYRHRVRFPGAVNSKFTTDMSFINPLESGSIPTYRVMDSDGVLVDKTRGRPDVSNEEVLTWYKNMLTGRFYAQVSLPGSFVGR
jgi:hypothetical protein